MHPRVILIAAVYSKRDVLLQKGIHHQELKQGGECSLHDMSMGFSQAKTIWTPFLHAVGYGNKSNMAGELPQIMFSSTQPKIIKNREKKPS